MKSLFTAVLIGAAAVGAMAQTPTAPQAPQPGQAPAKIVTTSVFGELMGNSGKVVKNAPFYAEGVSESVQTLFDGNRIVRSSSTKMYRDSDGRFRREGTANAGGTIGAYFNTQSTTISDPVTGLEYVLNDKNRTYRQTTMKSLYAPYAIKLEGYKTALEGAKKLQLESGARYAIAAPYNGTGQVDADTVARLRSAATPATQAQIEALVKGKTTLTLATASGQGMTTAFVAKNSKTEALGKQTIEGVECEGTRTTTTIPAGEIGNERPIDIVYEKWYSNELQTIVMSKHSDPRYGDQTYRLTNINRGEQDRSLFAPPSDYKISATGQGFYNFTPLPPMPAMPNVPVHALKGFDMPKPAEAPKVVIVPAPATPPSPAKEL